MIERPLQTSNSLLIRTPEGVVFSLLPAGPMVRLLAWSIDLACIATVMTTTGSLLRVIEAVSPDFAQAFYIVGYFVISTGYGMAAEWYWRGQTIGKRLLGLRVMDEQGLRLHVGQVVIRNLLRVVDSLPLFYFVGGIACLASRRAQRLGDIAANTIVVRNVRPAQPNLDQILSGKYNCLRDYPLLAARLRQRVSPEEAAIALASVLRRDELDPRARVELFQEIAAHFRSVTTFPEEATEGIPDEQYVRNVVDVLYGHSAGDL